MKPQLCFFKKTSAKTVLELHTLLIVNTIMDTFAH